MAPCGASVELTFADVGGHTFAMDWQSYEPGDWTVPCDMLRFGMLLPYFNPPMRNVILICVLVLVASLSCVGQLQNIVTDDAVGILTSAKKAAVFIELGAPAAARYVPDFTRAKRQTNEKLAKAKLQVVASPADADIVIVVHEINEGANSVTICLGDKVDVFKGGKAPAESDTPIWSVNGYCGIS